MAVQIPLDHSSPVPLYHQAATRIEQMIRSGELRPGEKLESETQLVERLGISRPTVRAALKELVDKGLLVRRRGIGTVVSSMPMTRPLALTSFYDDLESAGRRPTTQVLRLTRGPCPEEAREPLSLEAADEVYELERLRFADDEPISLMRNVLPTALVRLDEAALERDSLYRLLREQNVALHAATQRIGAAAASAEQARLLRIDPGSPLVAVRRTTYAPDGTPVEFARLHYPAHAYTVEMTLVER